MLIYIFKSGLIVFRCNLQSAVSFLSTVSLRTVEGVVFREPGLSGDSVLCVLLSVDGLGGISST